MKVGKIIFCVAVLPLSVMLSYKANKGICVYSEITLENVEALAIIEEDNKYICVGEGTKPCPYTGEGVKYVYIYGK